MKMETSDKGSILQNPRSVFQLMKKHYSRYDVDTVSGVTGTPKEDLLKVYETFCATGKSAKQERSFTQWVQPSIQLVPKSSYRLQSFRCY